jgi:hypothetical protein
LYKSHQTADNIESAGRDLISAIAGQNELIKVILALFYVYGWDNYIDNPTEFSN